MRIVAVLPALILAACAPTAAQTSANDRGEVAEQRKLARVLAGLVPGQPRNCLPQIGTQQAQTQAYGKTILYRYGPGLVYRSDTSGGCERIARGDVLVTRQLSGQLCQGDIATTVDVIARFQTGSCSFGPFVEYRRP